MKCFFRPCRIGRLYHSEHSVNTPLFSLDCMLQKENCDIIIIESSNMYRTLTDIFYQLQLYFHFPLQVGKGNPDL